MKQTFELKKYVNPKIKAGDKVKVIDGSAFSPLEYEEEDLYIVLSYPNRTGEETILKEIVGEVIYTGIENSICMGVCGSVYQQDIVVQLGNGLFRTCSKFVSKV